MDRKNLYHVMYGYLLARIYFGFFPQGEKLPSTYTLAKQFNVSEMTVRGALRLLEEDGYIQTARSRRAIITFDPEDHRKLPTDILTDGKVLQDLYQSLSPIFPNVFMHGFLLCREDSLEKLEQILHRPSLSWDEPTIDFLASIVRSTNNPLLVELYFDTMLFAYPTYLALLAQQERSWETAYDKLYQQLRTMLELRKSREDGSLWALIGKTYLKFNPHGNCFSPIEVCSRTYKWGKPQVCLNVASDLIYRIFCGEYPPGTFLPSATALAAESSSAVITMRRAIVLLGKMGVTESINGKGTKALFGEEGLQRIDWADPAVKSSLLAYLQSIHAMAITCRSAVRIIFPMISKEVLKRGKAEIIRAQKAGHSDVVDAFCIQMLVDASNLKAFKEIYGHLLGLLVWGYPLSYLGPQSQLEPYVGTILLGLQNEDKEVFAKGLEQLFFALFISSQRKMCSVGIQEAMELKLFYTEIKELQNLDMI